MAEYVVIGYWEVGYAEGDLTIIAPASSTHAHTADSPIIAGQNVVSPNDATSAHSAEQPLVSTNSILSINDATSAHSAEQPTIATNAAVSPASALHSHTAESPTVGYTVPTANPDSATHAHTAESPTVISDSALTIASATHGHSAEQVTIAGAAVVVINSVAHAHTAESPTITFTAAIAVNDATHVQLAEQPVIAFSASVGANDGTHSHSATSPPMSAEASQVLNALSDISNSNWQRSDQQAGDLYPLVDEGDEDWIYHSVSPATAEIKFDPAATPNRNTDHRIRYRISGDGAADVTVRLYCGATQIAQWVESAPSPTPQTIDRILTTVQADAITDYADLRLRFIGVSP